MLIQMRKEDAFQAVGRPKAIAEAIGVTRQAISQWGEFVPENSALKLLRLNPNIPHAVINQQKAPSVA